MADSWYDEFKRRITWALAVEHYRHGFVATPDVNYDSGYDPTYSGGSWESMDITIAGKCPCGEDVYATSSNVMGSAELIRTITSSDVAEDMAKDTNPFTKYEGETE